MKKVWYNWPQGYISYYKPWYKIFWSLAFSPLLFLGLAMIYMYCLITQGFEFANSKIQDLW